MEELKKLNATELQALCRGAGLETGSRNTEVLAPAVLGEREVPPNPMDKRRLQMMRYILKHWAAVESQLSCPARSGDPRACFGCTDIQVGICITQQPESKQREIEDG